MASQAQINANRENAKKSTGPRTGAGKQSSSHNALKHGLCAEKYFLDDDDPAEFQATLDRLYIQFQPVGEEEGRLVFRIANAFFRLDRAATMETGLFREYFKDLAHVDSVRANLAAETLEQENKERADNGEPPLPPPDPHRPTQQELTSRAFLSDSQGPNAFSKLSRYESALERSIERCTRLLKQTQSARKASTPPPDPPAEPAQETPCQKNPIEVVSPTPSINHNPKPDPSASPESPQEHPQRRRARDRAARVSKRFDPSFFPTTS